MTNFTIAQALRRLVEAKADYTQLIDNAAYDIGIYQPEGMDPQEPHSRDELYIVAAGTGQFIYAGESKPFGPGDLFFVPAGVDHRFEKFSKDFSTWVVFFGPRPSN